MIDKKIKICLLAMIMMLGVSAIAEEEPSMVSEATVQAEENELIKANKETFEKAQEAINKKDYQSAIVYLTAYISSKSKKYEAYKLRGEAFYALRQYKLASMDFQTAIELKASDDKFLTGTKVLGAVVLGADKQSQYQNPELGNLYGSLMYAQKAVNNPSYEVSYQKAVEYNSHIYLPQPKKEDIAKINFPQKYGKILNPQGDDTYIYGAIEDIEKGDFREAVFKAQYLISNYPKYYLGYYLSGVAFAGMEQEEDAITAFESSLKYNPYDFESLASLGQIYYNRAEKTFSKEDVEKSVDYFEKALVYNPNCYLYHYYIGLNNMITGSYDSAIARFNSAIKFKPNDYNSIYYKLVAQHIKGDYHSVITGTTGLLYRHVSNYNSVLYLRALASYKLGNVENAIEDIEKIHNNMNDIYNADIRTLSAKEKTLPNYLYYLKAKILKEQGNGVKADLAKAYENPIIAELSKGGNLENSSLKLSADEIEHQYDYIRTTFDDLGVSFTYLNPDYKFAVIKSSGDKTVKVSETPGLKASTSPLDTLTSENQTSIAQVLASQSFFVLQNEKTVKIEQNEAPKENNIAVEPQEQEDEITKVEDIAQAQPQPEIEPQTQPQSESEAEPVAETETNANTDTDTEQQATAVEQEVEKAIVEQEVTNNEAIAENEAESMKFVAEEVKEIPDFKITYENNKPAVSGLKENTVQEVPSEINSEVTEVIETEPAKVVEKHADVNLEEFNIIPEKTLEVKEGDEVVALEQEALTEKTTNPEPKEEQEEQKAEDIIAEAPAEKTVDVNVTKDEMTVKTEKEPEIVNVEIADSEPVEEPVTEPAVEVEDNTIIESAQTEVIENIKEQDIDQETTQIKKKRKAKKEMELKDFLAPSEVAQPKEKNVQEKKEQDLKDFLNESAPEISAVSQEDKPKKVKKSRKKIEKAEVPVVTEPETELPAFVQEIKPEKEKHVWFWQKKKAEISEIEETPVKEVLEVKQENIEDSVPEVEKPKKSWFGFLKRKKKSVVDTASTVTEEVTPEEIENEAKLDDIPYIRLDKAEVESEEVPASEKPKKDKQKKSVKEPKSEAETKVNVKRVSKVTEPLEILPSGKKVIKQMNRQ